MLKKFNQFIMESKGITKRPIIGCDVCAWLGYNGFDLEEPYCPKCGSIGLSEESKNWYYSRVLGKDWYKSADYQGPGYDAPKKPKDFGFDNVENI